MAELDGDALAFQDVAESLLGLDGGCFVRQARHGVVRNYVQQSRAAFQEFGQLQGMLGAIVQFGEKHVLERQPATTHVEVMVRRVEDLLDADAFIDRHNLRSQFVVGGMQRNGQVITRIEFRELVDRRRKSNGTDGDSAGADAKAIFCRSEVEGWDQPVDVGQRFAHSHHHNVAEAFPFGQQHLQPQHLFDDLSGRQIALDAVEA